MALESTTFLESLDKTSHLFGAIGDTHCQVYYKEKYFKTSRSKQVNYGDLSSEFLEKHLEGAEFEVNLLQEKYAYVLIPSLTPDNYDPQSPNAVAQSMYDQMVALDEATKLKGWIIDLRFNTGGNADPILASLYHLLGNTTVSTKLDIELNIIGSNVLDDGAIISAEEGKVEVQVGGKPNRKIPVAIITGLMTSGAGEKIAVAFRGRRNVRFIGEETYGLLFGNEEVNLPYGAVMSMTTSLIGDRNGYYSKSIIPDTPVKKMDNFTLMSDDGNIMEAIKFIDSK